jgi:TubC N-terminal docking domain
VNAAELLERLRSAGCRVGVGDRGQLVIDAPRGVLDSDFRCLLAERKQGILALIVADATTAAEVQSAPQPVHQDQGEVQTSGLQLTRPTETPSELESLLSQVESDVRRLTSDPRLLQAARNLLADCRAFWREGKTETAFALARDYTRRIPAYIVAQANQRRSMS